MTYTHGIPIAKLDISMSLEGYCLPSNKKLKTSSDLLLDFGDRLEKILQMGRLPNGSSKSNK